jgi:PAS domain S-box-containing protein
MSESASQLAYLRDPRLSAHALDAAPAWLWTTDATRILWANAVGAAIFDACGPAELAGRHFEARDPAALQIVRIADTLPLNAAPRLERLRGFGATFGRALTCGCSRISLSDDTAAILVVAAKAAGPALPLEERVRRLLLGIEAPIAIFSAAGDLLHAAEPALDRLAATTTLEFLGAETLAAHALRAGYAAGPTKVGALSIERIGNDDSPFLVATLAASQRGDETTGPHNARAAAQAAPRPEPAMPDVTDQEADIFANEAMEQSGDAPAAAPPPAPTPAPVDTAPERRYPLRFVWQMDAHGRFTIESDDFIRLTGARTADALGRRWDEIAQLLDLDPQSQVAQAFATRDTWSGITIAWPVDGTSERLAVELSGLPVFDRDRAFGGYRGFGVCRDARRISLAASLRHVPGSSEPADVFAPAAAAAEIPRAAGDERPTLTVVPPAKNVVPFRATAAEKAPSLSPVERSAFRELAKELTSRLQQGKAEIPAAPLPADDFESEPPAEAPASPGGAYGRVESDAKAVGFIQPQRAPKESKDLPAVAHAATEPLVSSPVRDERMILDRLPVGVLVYRLDTPLYANAAFLDWSGYVSVAELAGAGGLNVLYVKASAEQAGEAAEKGQLLTVTSNQGKQQPTECRLFTVPWEGEPAHILMVLPPQGGNESSAAALRLAEAEARELKSILDTAMDGVLVLDREGRILACNHSAEALFGDDRQELTASLFVELFASESRRTALDYLDEVSRGGAGMPDCGREVIGRLRRGGLAPLFLTIGRIADRPEKFCAVFRDLTRWKKTEEELINAKRQAENASTAKSEFLAKISHEIRTPLNSIMGFSEVMMAERFGPIANERYLGYLKGIHESGGHLISLLNDLLDLSKIEAGKLDLTFASINLNEVIQHCVALMQPQANQQKVIIRASLPPSLPPIMADARSVRQIVLNLLSNSIKFTSAGGQVIVSTALADAGAVVLRVRDTGHGMSEKDIEVALEPFRQIATSSSHGSGGSGLGLPLTKALAEANRGTFAIKSAVNAGTLVEISFPQSGMSAN